MNTNPDIQIYLHGKIAGIIIPQNVVLMEAEINYTNLHYKNDEQILLLPIFQFPNVFIRYQFFD